MRVGIVRTAGSPCRCAEALSEGLRALGHGVRVVDAAAVEAEAGDLARDCDLVFDHTDTFAGGGRLRPFVRLVLESRGVRCAGSDARACARTDDKAATKERLAAAGVPVPPGVVVAAPPARIPPGLEPPYVLKPVYEHMSRGVRLESAAGGAAAAAERMLRELRQPVIVESFVRGRELAVTVLGREAGPPEVLPPLEWRVEGILTEDHKLRRGEERQEEGVRADLAPEVRVRVETLALRAFAALDLADYARFDVRLADDGTPFFLEANTKPSLEWHESLVRSAGWAGMDLAGVADRLVRAAVARLGSVGSVEGLPGGTVEVAVPAGVHPLDASTVELARLLDVAPGESVLDLGCGAGLLAVAAARKGAGRVVATDVDRRALDAAAANARRAGVGERVGFREGAWYAPVAGEPPFDVIVATPPQTPGPFPFGPRYGGPDGTEHLLHVLDGAPARLRREGGRLWLLAVSLAHPRRVRERLEERFADVALVKETVRPFTAEEMEARAPGLMDHLRRLRDRGMAEFEDGPPAPSFRCRLYRAARPR